MLTCKGCGHQFKATTKEHYIARDDSSGSFICPAEVTLYDAFDCPVCGCQVIVQERKRVFDKCEDGDTEGGNEK